MPLSPREGHLFRDETAHAKGAAKAPWPHPMASNSAGSLWAERVPSCWKPPDPFKGVSTADMHNCRTLLQTGAYRADPRAEDWVGYMVADVLKIDVVHGADNDPKDIARIKQSLQLGSKTRSWRPWNARTKNA